MSINPALGRQRQRDHEFKASVGYTVRCCFKKRMSGEDEGREMGKES